jgi:hypothetical protein
VDTAPTVELPPAIPLTLQVTAVFEDPLTAAVNCWLWETTIEVLDGDTVTEIPPTTVTVACAEIAWLATLVAVTTTAVDGGTAGAV